jgi:hypothetical protein
VVKCNPQNCSPTIASKITTHILLGEYSQKTLRCNAATINLVSFKLALSFVNLKAIMDTIAQLSVLDLVIFTVPLNF